MKAISTALPSGLIFELADGNPREATCCSEAAADAVLWPSLDSSD